MIVKSFMLATGQELIAEYEGPSRDGFLIKNPLVAHMMNDGKGGVQLGFAPWSLLHKADQSIVLRNVLAEPIDVEQEISDSYVSQQTGLILPGAGSQLLQG